MKIFFDYFQEKNFFNLDDINFFKNLIKYILKSKFFTSLLEENSDFYKDLNNYNIFTEDENIDNLINRIKIFPYIGL